MTEAEDGGMPPKRPEKSVFERSEIPQYAGGKEAQENRKPKRRRRRGKRSKDAPADTENVGAAPAAANESSRASSGEGEVQLSDAPKSKRARRRRWRGKRKSQSNADSPPVHNGQAQSPFNEGEVRHEAIDATQKNGEGTSSQSPETAGQEHLRNRRQMPNPSSQANKGESTSKRSSRNGRRNRRNSHKAGEAGRNEEVRPKQNSNGRRMRADAYAALDLGTNNCRLLVAVPQQPGRFKVIDAFSRIVRLGEGLAHSGELSEAAMTRAIGALRACADKLENRQVRGVRLIATEACRQATNGGEFLQRVEAEAGLKLEVVDRETEARLAVAGCSSLVDRQAKGVVLFDIGGGSSELALLDLRQAQRRSDVPKSMVSWTSLPLGVVTLSEKHGGGKNVTPSVFEAMVGEVAELLSGFAGRHALVEAAEQGEIHLLGTSGTVTTLAGIHLKLPRYNRRLVDGIWMKSDDVTAMINALVNMSFEERIANPCIGRDRADLVLAGCAILVAIQRLWPCPRLRVADRGLREGLLTEMMNADNAWQRRQKMYRPRNQNRRPD